MKTELDSGTDGTDRRLWTGQVCASVFQICCTRRAFGGASCRSCKKRMVAAGLLPCARLSDDGTGESETDPRSRLDFEFWRSQTQMRARSRAKDAGRGRQWLTCQWRQVQLLNHSKSE
jgi:hypothetical protein